MNFTERRKQVFDKMDQDSALLLFSGIELHVSADEYLPFEANRNFFYLTGLRRDHMILMMKKTAKEEEKSHGRSDRIFTGNPGIRASWRNEWKSIVNGGNQCIFF